MKTHRSLSGAATSRWEQNNASRRLRKSRRLTLATLHSKTSPNASAAGLQTRTGKIRSHSLMGRAVSSSLQTLW